MIKAEILHDGKPDDLHLIIVLVRAWRRGAVVGSTSNYSSFPEIKLHNQRNEGTWIEPDDPQLRDLKEQKTLSRFSVETLGIESLDRDRSIAFCNMVFFVCVSFCFLVTK